MAEEHQSPPPPEETYRHPYPYPHHQKPMDEKHHHEKHMVSPPPPPPRRAYPPPENSRRTICTALTILLLLAGLTVLIIWLIYRPQKPQFTVIGAAIYDLNITTPPFISTSMQFTLLTRNPNKRVSIIYNRLNAYVSYKNQMITVPVTLPPLYHERKSTVAMSPVLNGVGVPVAAEVVNGLAMDEGYGVVGLRVVVLGRLRWKAGAIRTARYGVYVRCDVWVGIKRGVVGQVPLLGSPQCKVDV